MFRPMTRAGVALLCSSMLASCDASSDDVVLPEEDRFLEAIMEQYVSERFRFYPVESTLSGLPGNDDRLGVYSQSAIAARIAWLADFRHRIMGVRLTALSRPAYLDSLWLTSLVKAELFELEERALWRRSAAFYGDVVRLGLVSLLAEGELASRSDALAGRLGDVPRILHEARANLGPADPVWRAKGLASLDACRQLLEDLPEMLENRVPPHQLAELAGLSRAATRSVQDFLAELPVLQSGEDPSAYSLGDAALERFWFHRHMLDWPVDEVARRADDELTAVTNALTDLALDRLASQSLPAVLAPEPLTDSLEASVAAAEARASAFIRSRDGAVPLDPAIPVRRVPGYFPGTEVVQLWRPKALEPSRGAFLMVRETAGVDANELELLTLREIGGRARQFARQAASASLLRRVFANPATSEGLLARFERRALEAGYQADDVGLRVAHHRRAMLDLARLLAVIQVHAHGATVDEAAALFRERALLGPGPARAEAQRVAVAPEVGDAALGRLLVLDLADEYERAHPLSSERELDEQLLAEGLSPVPLLRFQAF